MGGTYLFKDDLFEDLHPCAFSAKTQTHDMDNPAYKDIFKCEKIKRENFDGGIFETLSQPRGASILQSTWDFRKKHYSDG